MSFVLLTSISIQAQYSNYALGNSAPINRSSSSNNSVFSQQQQVVKIIKTYPNPAIDRVTFEFNRSYNSGYSIEIYNLPGKRVAILSNVSTSTPLFLQNYYRGVYIYKLVDRNGRVIESGKFQVSN